MKLIAEKYTRSVNHSEKSATFAVCQSGRTFPA